MTLSRAHRLFRPFCWLAWLSLFAPLAGQSVADEGVDRGLLFRVQAAGSGGPSWLFGTIHSEDARVLALPELVQQSLGRARAFAMEVVPDADAMAQSTAAMRYTTARRCRTCCRPNCMPVASVPSPSAGCRKPWCGRSNLGRSCC
jgi:hypothetical protein